MIAVKRAGREEMKLGRAFFVVDRPRTAVVSWPIRLSSSLLHAARRRVTKTSSFTANDFVFSIF
jgi:hypothetical protein